MKTIALFACLGFLVACGEKESTTPDKTPAATDVEKMAGDKTPRPTCRRAAPRCARSPSRLTA
jgi:hypothetical protein